MRTARRGGLLAVGWAMVTVLSVAPAGAGTTAEDGTTESSQGSGDEQAATSDEQATTSDEPSAEPSPSPSASSPTPAPSPTPTSQPSPSPASEPSPTPTPAPSPSPSPSPTREPAQQDSGTRTQDAASTPPQDGPSPQDTPSASPSPTSSPEATERPGAAPADAGRTTPRRPRDRDRGPTVVEIDEPFETPPERPPATVPGSNDHIDASVLGERRDLAEEADPTTLVAARATSASRLPLGALVAMVGVVLLAGGIVLGWAWREDDGRGPV